MLTTKVIIAIIVGLIWFITFISDKIKEANVKKPNRPQPRIDDDVQREIERFLNDSKKNQSSTQQRKEDPNPHRAKVDEAFANRLDDRFEEAQAARRKRDYDLQQERDRSKAKRDKQLTNKVQQPQQPSNQGKRQQSQPQEKKAKRARIQDEVKQHIDTSSFDERSAKLAHVKESVQQIDQHVHQKFDHEIGKLTNDISTIASQSTENRGPAVQIHAKDIRNAIILSEILTRPEQRWENLERTLSI
jgi:hypothetical protein